MSEEFNLNECPLTKLPISDGKAWRVRFQNPQGIFYRVIFEGEEKPLRICPSLYTMLTGEKDSYYLEEVEKLNKSLPYFLGSISKNNFEDLWDKTIHWDCRTQGHKYPDKHLHVKPIAEQELEGGSYPKSIKEKTNKLLLLIKNDQTQDGAQITLKGKLNYWTTTYMKNPEELYFYLSQLEKKGLVEVDSGKVNLTFDGLEYVDGINTSKSVTSEIMEPEEMYQIGLSFAGEQRAYVQQVAEELKQLGITVFYDDYEKVNLWGKDLYQHLNDVYKNKCEYCIIFISQEYARKLWTQHELSSAQTKAFKENREYILPVRFDETEIPGLNETIGYLNAINETPQRIALLAKEKLDENKHNGE